METELSFLLEMVLNDKPNKVIKDKLLERIKLIQAPRVQMASVAPMGFAQQSPSTLAAMARHETEQLPTAPIATTPAAAQALAARQQIINDALNGKPEKGRTSPRKF